MATTVWRGQLTFALVSFPVRLFRAARAERVHFKRLARTGGRAPQVRETRNLVVAVEPEFEPPSAPAPASRPAGRPSPAPAAAPEPEVVRGFEVEKGNYAIVEEEEIRELAPETSKEMQVVEFVRFEEIDPIYLETSYYLRPDEPGERPYALLLEAMRKSGYAGLAELAMHRREHVVVLRPGNTGIIAHTMYYPDEVRRLEEFRADTSSINKKELELASRLIGSMAVPFEPEKFRDSYRERLQALIESKTPARAARKPAAAAIDIMAALQKSLQKGKRAS